MAALGCNAWRAAAAPSSSTSATTASTSDRPASASTSTSTPTVFAITCNGCGAAAMRAFSPLDRSGNGLIDDGAELFGVGTPHDPRRPQRAQWLRRSRAVRLAPARRQRRRHSSAKPMPSGRSLRLWIDHERGRCVHARRNAHAAAASGSRRSIPFRKSASTSMTRATVIPYWAWATQRPVPGRALHGRCVLPCAATVVRLTAGRGHGNCPLPVTDTSCAPAPRATPRSACETSGVPVT